MAAAFKAANEGFGQAIGAAPVAWLIGLVVLAVTWFARYAHEWTTFKVLWASVRLLRGTVSAFSRGQHTSGTEGRYVTLTGMKRGIQIPPSKALAVATRDGTVSRVIAAAGDKAARRFLEFFPNQPKEEGGHVVWDIERIWQEVLRGLRIAAAETGGRVESIGLDSSGAEYLLVDHLLEAHRPGLHVARSTAGPGDGARLRYSPAKKNL